MEVDFESHTLFTMHDLVNDLARSVMVDEIFVSGKQGNTGGSSYHFALLNDCRKPLDSSKIRALRFMECGEIELHGAAFSSSKSMRVLDLSDCYIHKLPDSIGVLKQLRYLNAPRVKDANIPNSITRLSKLLYLNLHGSLSILALPESIGEIESLLYLDLSGCSSIKKLPDSFGRLNNLVHLDLSNCSCVGGISAFLGSLTQLIHLNLSYCPNIGELPEALGCLSKLQYLNLSFSSYLECCQEVEVLGTLTKLEYLNLSSNMCNLITLPEALSRFIQLKYLNLSGYVCMIKLPSLFGSLKNLVHLDLSDCVGVDCLDEALVGLSNLEHLNLHGTCISLLPEDLTKLRYLNLSEMINIDRDAFLSLINHICSNFFDLEHLDLSSNYGIRSIPESIGSLRKLHTLDLSKCSHLKEISESVRTIDSLKFLYLNGCRHISEPPQLGGSALSLPHFVVQPGNDESGSNLVKLQSIDPIELRITKLENVKSVQEAERIKLTEKHNLEILTLEWTRDVERSVDNRMLLEKLVPPSTLKKLEICGYNGVSFPAWVVGQLPNLKELVLRDMASLEEWDTSYCSGEEHVIESLEIHDCPMLRMKLPLPRVKCWTISNSDNVLSSWEECTASHTNASSSSSPVTIEMLSVRYSKVPLHEWMLLQHLPGLHSLSIKNCGDLTSSPEIIQHMSSLKTLCLEDGDLEELPKWIGELTSLKDLQIENSGELKGLDENMRQLTKLQSLELAHCGSIASLPHWLGVLTSLKELSVWRCDALRSLPESIQQLTYLRKLRIVFCPELKHFVEPEEQTVKLAHNQEKVCVLPTSLEALEIWNCKGIRSLPEGIQQLTNLQKLDINGCPELKRWCESEENQMKLAHIRLKDIRDPWCY